MNNKGSSAIVLALIIVILSLIGGASYYFYESKIASEQSNVDISSSSQLVGEKTDIPADWKIYKEKDFFFQYPPDATAESIRETSEITPKPEILIRVTPLYQPPWDKYYNLLISVEDNPKSLSSQDLINEYIKTFEVHPATEGTIDKIKESVKEYKNGDVNGLIINDGVEYDWLVVYQVKDHKNYTFRITGDQGELNDYVIEMFDKILATFKFIE